mmetsp:Transcript_20895/g.30899  ORF Transcript_20895/g.30899 Transcript_20895/m.30899 type:complete len:227 (+) Transcript_20895:59-739(+)
MAKGDKGKFNKRGGGGSRFQATSADEIEARNSRIAEFDEQRSQRRAEAEENEGSGEVEKAAAGVAALGIAENPNRPKEEVPLTRKQMEQADRERKAADYRRRHELGLTDEFKRDMEALAKVKRRREESEKKAKELEEIENAVEAERLAGRASAVALTLDDSDSDDEDAKKKKKKSKKKTEIPKIDKIGIKKMKPAQLKEALKERGCDIQGNAKTLTARLLEFEANR